MKYRIKKIELNNGEITYTPEKKNQRLHPTIVIAVALFPIVNVFAFFEMIKTAIDDGYTVFLNYKWEEIGPGTASRRAAEIKIEEDLAQDFKDLKQQRILDDQKEGMKVKAKTYLKHP